jgi:hypothetical protein
MMTEELSVKGPLEEVIEERVLDVLGARVRVREVVVLARGRRRSFLELTLLAPDGSSCDRCLIDVRGHDEAGSLLPTAAAAFVASSSLRISQRALGGDRW